MQALTEQVEILRPEDFADVSGTSYAVHAHALRDSRGNFITGKWYELHGLASALSNLYSPAKLSFISTRDLERGLHAGVLALDEWTGTNSLVSVPNQNDEHLSRFEPQLPKSRYLKLVHDVVPSTDKRGLSYSYDPNDVIDIVSLLSMGINLLDNGITRKDFPKKLETNLMMNYLEPECG